MDDEAYPETWIVGDLELRLSYEFDPASETDGVTIHVPVGALDRLDPAMFEWQVPGLRPELVSALVNLYLPKMRSSSRLPVGMTPLDRFSIPIESGLTPTIISFKLYAFLACIS